MQSKISWRRLLWLLLGEWMVKVSPEAGDQARDIESRKATMKAELGRWQRGEGRDRLEVC